MILSNGHVCLVGDSGSVEVFDVSTAQSVWTWELPGKTTRSGEPPLVVPSREGLFVIVPENVGYRLHRLDARTGKPTWPNPPLIALDALDEGAWVAGPDALYHADGEMLIARILDRGAILWQRPLSPRGAWKLELSGETLLARLRRGNAIRFQFRFPLGSVQWEEGPLTGEALPAVELLDAKSGTLVQRIHLEEASLHARTRLETGPTTVWPSGMFWQEPRWAEGIAVGWDDKGLLVGLGNQVKSFTAAEATTEK